MASANNLPAANENENGQTTGLQIDDYTPPQTQPPLPTSQGAGQTQHSSPLAKDDQITASKEDSNIIPVGGPVYVQPLERLDETPDFIDCPFCEKRTKTRVEHVDSTATTLAGAICCLLTLVGTCIPCLCGWCQETDHYCTECNHQVTHKPEGGPVQVMKPQARGLVPSKYAYSSAGGADQIQSQGQSQKIEQPAPPVSGKPQAAWTQDTLNGSGGKR